MLDHHRWNSPVCPLTVVREPRFEVVGVMSPSDGLHFVQLKELDKRPLWN